MTVQTPEAPRRRGRPPRVPQPDAVIGEQPQNAFLRDLNKATTAIDILHEQDEWHGKNLVSINGTMVVLCDYLLTKQDIRSGHTTAENGTVYEESGRTSDKVILWVRRLVDDKGNVVPNDDYDPKDRRKGAEVFHAFSHTLTRLVGKIPTEAMPLMATFVQRETQDDRRDPRTGDPYTAWVIE